jgi:DNA-binding SARP family transcriptional activator/Tfp pilus assembly protein PilF
MPVWLAADSAAKDGAAEVSPAARQPGPRTSTLAQGTVCRVLSSSPQPRLFACSYTELVSHVQATEGTPRWRLILLGQARVEGVGPARRPAWQAPLERRAAALLAYLALEGPTPRSTLAGLLWPDSMEQTARANLRQRLKRLRESLGTELVLPGEVLRLRPGLDVDAASLESLAFLGEAQEVVARSGTLLAGLDYDDLPELETWVLTARARAHALRRSALSTLADSAEQAGEYAQALTQTEGLLLLDPVSEQAHRRAMRLHYLAGDRAAAAMAYERCRATLRRELDADPLPETRQLAQAIARGSELSVPRVPTRRRIPLGVLRPPRLAGRDGEWAQLDAAWAARQAVFVCGVPGSGKTRLATDFALSQGAVLRAAGRPGDADVPYSAFARSLRQWLAPGPDGWPHHSLPGWTRRELSRLIPELEPDAALPNIRGDAEKLRFFQAVVQAVQVLATGPPASLLFDDLQFMDAGSFELGVFTVTRAASEPEQAWPRALFTFRSGELEHAVWVKVQALVQSGAALLIELGPLGEPDVQALLQAVEWGDTDPEAALAAGAPAPFTGLARGLHRYTGGNPLFIVETLKHLCESGQMGQEFPARLPPPGQVGPLIRRRLERLSPGALRLAQTAAVAGSDFTLLLGAQVLDAPVLGPASAAQAQAAPALAPLVAELEAAQVLRGEVFVHDLLLEATLGTLPPGIRRLLHRQVARALETATLGGADHEPASIARHFGRAGEPDQAARWWLRAAWSFQALGRESQAAELFAQVLSGEHGVALRTEAQHGLGVSLSASAPELAEAHLQAALLGAIRLRQLSGELQVRAALAELYRLRGRLREGLEHLHQVLTRLPPGTPSAQRAEIYRARFWLELRSGQLGPAKQSIEAAAALVPDHPLTEDLRALLYWHQGRFAHSAAIYEALMAAEWARTHPDEFGMVVGNIAWTYWALARNDEAARLIERQLTLPASPYVEGLIRSNYSVVLTSLGRGAEALAQLDRARMLLAGYDLPLLDVSHRAGYLSYLAGRYPQACFELAQAETLGRRVGDPYRLSYVLATLGAAQARGGDVEGGQVRVTEGLAVARRIRFPLTTVIALQGCAVVALEAGRAQAALAFAREAAALARTCGMPEQLGAARLQEGLAGLATGQGVRGQQALREALEIGRRHHLPDLRRRAAAALGLDDEAGQIHSA